MQKLKKILNPGSSKDDEVMYAGGDANSGKLAGEGSHFGGKEKPSRGFSKRSKSGKSASPSPSPAPATPAELDSKNTATTAAAKTTSSAAPTTTASQPTVTNGPVTQTTEAKSTQKQDTTIDLEPKPTSTGATLSADNVLADRTRSDVSGSVYSQDAFPQPATTNLSEENDNSHTGRDTLLGAGAGAGAGAVGAAGIATHHHNEQETAPSTSTAPLSTTEEGPARNLSREEKEIQDATYTYRSYQLASPGKPQRQDSMPAVPGRFPSTDGTETQTQSSLPTTSGVGSTTPTTATATIPEEPSTPAKSQTQTPKKDDSNFGRNAAIAGGLGAAGATAYGLSQHGKDDKTTNPSEIRPAVVDQARTGQTATTGPAPSRAESAKVDPVTPTKQSSPIAPISQQSATVPPPSFGTSSTQPESLSSKPTTASSPAQATPAKRAEPIVTKQQTPTKPNDEHHHGRDALAAGGLGAAVAGAFGLAKDHDKAEPTAAPSSAVPSTTQPAQQDVPKHTPSKRGGFFSGPQGTAVSSSPTTSATAYSEQRATPHVPHKEGMQDAAAGGAGGSLGTGSFELPKNQHAPTHASSQQPSSAAQTSKDDSHTGRNAALAGGAVAATGAGAYALHNRGKDSDVPPGTAVTTPDTRTSGTIGQTPVSQSMQPPQNTAQTSHPTHTTAEKAIPAAAVASTAPATDDKVAPTGTSEKPIESQDKEDQSHFGRNAALAGGAAVAGGAAAHELSKKDEEKLAKEQAKEAERAQKEQEKELARQEKEAKHKADQEAKAAKHKADEEAKAAKKQAEKDEKAAKKQAEKDEKAAKKQAEKDEKAAKKQHEKDEKEAKKKAEKEAAAAAAAAEVERKREEKEREKEEERQRHEAEKEEQRKRHEAEKEEEKQRKLAEKEDKRKSKELAREEKRKSKEVEREESKAEKKRKHQEEAAALAAAEAERKHHEEETKKANEERDNKLRAEKEERERQEKLQKEREHEADKEEKGKKRRSVFGFLHRDKDSKDRSPSAERKTDDEDKRKSHNKEIAAGTAGVAGAGAAAYILHDRDENKADAAHEAGTTTTPSATQSTAPTTAQETSTLPDHENTTTAGPTTSTTAGTSTSPTSTSATTAPVAAAGTTSAPNTVDQKHGDNSIFTKSTTDETRPDELEKDSHKKEGIAAGAGAAALGGGAAYAATRGRDDKARDVADDRNTTQPSGAQTATTSDPTATKADKHHHDKHDKHDKHAEDEKEEKSKKRRSFLGFLHRDKSKDRDEKASDRERSKSRPREPAVAPVAEEKTDKHDNVATADHAPATTKDGRAQTPEQGEAHPDSTHGTPKHGGNTDGVGRHHSKLHKDPPKKVQQELEKKAEEMKRKSYEENGQRHMGTDGEIGGHHQS